ncbi:MAG: phosphotransferase [Anaerolineae bacterium]|nr:phosphotransferase [Anaerolineae bacterium]
MTSDEQLPGFLLQACRRAFGGRAEMVISDLKPISDGWECEVWSFDLESREDGAPRCDGLALRIYPGEGGPAKAAREFAAMRQLYRQGYPVPQVFCLDRDDAGRPIVIMERIEGRLLGQVIATSLQEEQERLLGRFCRLFVDLHSLDWRPFVSDPDSFRPEGCVSRWLEEARAFIDRFGATEAVPVLDWLCTQAANVRSVRPAVTHLDFHPWNILLRSDGAAFVIDWTQAGVTDPRFDLAWTLLLTEGSLGHEARDYVLARYEHLAGCRAEDLAFFEAAAAAKRVFSIWLSFRVGPEALGMRPEAIQLMAQSSHHLRSAYALLRERTGLRLLAVEELIP